MRGNLLWQVLSQSASYLLVAFRSIRRHRGDAHKTGNSNVGFLGVKLSSEMLETVVDNVSAMISHGT